MSLLRFGKCCLVFRSCLFIFHRERVSSLSPPGYILLARSDLSVHICILCMCRHLEDWFIFWNVLSSFLGEHGRLPSQLLKDNCASHTHPPRAPFCLKHWDLGTVFTETMGIMTPPLTISQVGWKHPETVCVLTGLEFLQESAFNQACN